MKPKITSQKQLDEYLNANEKRIAEASALNDIVQILKEQNKVLNDYIHFKCEEIKNG